MNALARTFAATLVATLAAVMPLAARADSVTGATLVEYGNLHGIAGAALAALLRFFHLG